MMNSFVIRRHVSLLKRLSFVGFVVLACGLFVARDRIWSNLLLGGFYMLSIALGGAVFVALTYVTGAGWHVAFRRVPESLARILPESGLAVIAVLGVAMSRYGWHHHGAGGAGTFWFKELWLTPSFWLGRAIVYVVLWSLLGRGLLSYPRKLNGAKSIINKSLPPIFLAVYAVTFSLACIDWLMALDPLWFSTIWGVYHFSGMMQATLAVVIILCLLFRSNNGPLSGVFNDEHLHDMGRLLLGFSCFWMYIWFSQYMLIWYSNIPEETSYFIDRMSDSWGPVVISLIILNWIVPFFALLPKPAKRSGTVMMKVAIIVLIGRWLDLYLMIFPATTGGAPVFGIWEVAAICCLIGTGGLLVLRSFGSVDPVPLNDPYLSESLHYHAG